MKTNLIPEKALGRIESAAAKDLKTAMVTLGFLRALAGSYDSTLFPGYCGGIEEIRGLPASLRRDLRAIGEWTLAGSVEHSFHLRASAQRIEAGVRLLRGNSLQGKRFRMRARSLMERYPVLTVKPWDASVSSYKLLPEEVGRPLTEGIITLGLGFRPKFLQVVANDASLNCTWINGALTIRLNADRYSVGAISIAYRLPKQVIDPTIRRFEGDLIDFFETGLEGICWMLLDDRFSGYEALQSINEGDHLTILDQLGRPQWSGTIRFDNKVGWRRYPLNPRYGKQSAMGQWVHWIQKGFRPDVWAAFFIRPAYDRLRGILVRRRPMSSAQSKSTTGIG